MRIDILTLFPGMFIGPFDESVLKRAQAKKLLQINIHNIRDSATNLHHTVDDTPYGGGPGMVMRVDILDRALTKIKQAGRKTNLSKPHVILMTPQGSRFHQTKAYFLSHFPWLILICGHYEGYDERIRSFVDEEISIGDYVLTGGELPAMVITDAVTRLIPGVIGKESSLAEESFTQLSTSNSATENLLEYPQYTRPEIYKKQAVPAILLSGNHQAIAQWRHEQALQRTRHRRPDLISEG